MRQWDKADLGGRVGGKDGGRAPEKHGVLKAPRLQNIWFWPTFMKYLQYARLVLSASQTLICIFNSQND